MLGELRVEPFGPLDALYAAVRRRAPQVAATRARVPEGYSVPKLGEFGVLSVRLHVSYRDCRARRICWDGDAGTYVWASGPDKGVLLAPGVEQATTQIAGALGAPVSPEPSAG
ncbi:hypothetical protein AGRA3207_001681 [Actinomadura graeca]|uniref:Uncharacterized protein n=1 Tax=Actinomadura graeca TaxID=2750812 RepID=A0ABX8QVS3_9ACTN|nr:hypothetical protein [Actinomadura graeca]QXJ20888.1 hypothetical protein AGRA3207_001681 [Actinomadura graeca]